MKAAIAPFMKLFRYFSISQEQLDRFQIKHATCFLSKVGEIDNVSINKEIEEISNQLKNNGITDLELDEIIKNKGHQFPDCYDSLLRYVSGKDYLIPYICNLSEKKLSLSLGLSKENWKYQYAKYCKLDRLSNLKTAIKDAVK